VKSFQFRLRQVLTARRRVEDEHAVELGAHVRQRDAAAARVEALAGETSLARSGVLAAATVGVSGADLQLLAQRVEAARVAIDRARTVLFEAVESTEAARARLVEAARARRALERLEERQRAEHAAAMRRAEQVMLDDVGASYVVWRDVAEQPQA